MDEWLPACRVDPSFVSGSCFLVSDTSFLWKSRISIGIKCDWSLTYCTARVWGCWFPRLWQHCGSSCISKQPCCIWGLSTFCKKYNVLYFHFWGLQYLSDGIQNFKIVRAWTILKSSRLWNRSLPVGFSNSSLISGFLDLSLTNYPYSLIISIHAIHSFISVYLASLNPICLPLPDPTAFMVAVATGAWKRRKNARERLQLWADFTWLSGWD